MHKQPLITLTSDFGVQSQGVGIMEGVVFEIVPHARVIHLMHGLPDYNIMVAARTLETLVSMPVGFHVCVVDPGVGTKRRGLIIKTKRGDYLIGPDNGVLMPAARLFGGAEKIVEITNPKYMRHPVSPLFHGRDVFVPAAAYLASGAAQKEFGREIPFQKLTKAPYEEAIQKANRLEAKVIHINKYGSLHLNILNVQWDEFGMQNGEKVNLHFQKKKLVVTAATTFGDVPKGKSIIVKDDYGRVEVAINRGNFAKTHRITLGGKCVIQKC